MAGSNPSGGFNPRQIQGVAQEAGIRDGSIQRETAGFVAPGQSALTLTGSYTLSTTGVTTIPLHSVPAGKIFCITDIALAYNTASQYDMQLQSGSIPIFRQVVKGDTAPLEMPGIETPPVVLGGQTLNLVLPSNASTSTIYDFVISGFQQDIGIG